MIQTGKKKYIEPEVGAESSRLDVILAARNGVSGRSIEGLITDFGLPQQTIANALAISVKTLNRYRNQKKNLNSVHGEVVLKITKLFLKGKEIFGSTDRFMVWLKKPSYGLSDEIPFRLIQTPAGIDCVTEELRRIEYGDIS